MRRLASIAAALLIAGCAAKQPAPPALPPPLPETAKPAKPQPRAKPAAPAAPQTEAKSSPADTCRSLALQRAADAKSLGKDTKAQLQVRNETYADCMTGQPIQ